MGSRIRKDPKKVFELFTEIAWPSDGSTEPFILQQYPADYAEEDVLKSVCRFAFPWQHNTEHSTVDHFTFVLTDIDSNFRFGFCRHATSAHTCLCVISYLPWYEIFYKLLNHLADVLNKSDNGQLHLLLEALSQQPVPSAGLTVHSLTPNSAEKFSFVAPDPETLPSIPESRNLTEYYNAVHATNMMIMFASMLHERRVLIVSKKLSRLTACIHGAAALIYPMYWQHLYIPVLPPKLIDYCSAPMPYLIGLHSSVWEKVKREELGDAVILDADADVISSEYDDLADIPSDIVSTLKKRLKGQTVDKTSSSLMGDGVSRAFLKAIVQILGGYRDGLRFRPDEQITFDEEAFIVSRSPASRPFLRQMLQLQIFEQFVFDRLEMLNCGRGFTGLFEAETTALAADQWGTQSRYHDWLHHMKKQSKKGKEKWVEFTSRANPAVKHAVETVKNKSKKAYKDLKLKMDEMKKEDDSPSDQSLSSGHSMTPVSELRRPPRPPAPNLSQIAQRHSVTRKSVYDKTRQYKVMTFNGESIATESGMRLTKRISSRDDSELARVSLDLMDDPDIQNFVKKSYSLEDVSQLPMDDEDDDNPFDMGRGPILKQQLSRPDGQRLSQSSSSPDFLRDVPTPAARRSALPPPQQPLVQLADSGPLPMTSSAMTSSAMTSSFPAQNLMRPVSRASTLPRDAQQWSEQNGRQAAEQREAHNPIPLPRRRRQKEADGSLDGDDASSPVPKPRRTLSRNSAFYRDRPQPVCVVRKAGAEEGGGVRYEGGMREEGVGVREARAAFLQPGGSQQLSAGSLQQFDPLLSGQLALDAAPSSDVAAEEDLLKEWNLDFAGLANMQQQLQLQQLRQRRPPVPMMKPQLHMPVARVYVAQPMMTVPQHRSVRSQVLALSQPRRVVRSSQPFIPAGTVASLQRNYRPAAPVPRGADSQDPFDDLLSNTLAPAVRSSPPRPVPKPRTKWTTFE